MTAGAAGGGADDVDTDDGGADPEALLAREDVGIMLVRDADGLIERCNARAAALMGLPADRLAGHRLTGVAGDFARFAEAAYGPLAPPPGAAQRVDLPRGALQVDRVAIAGGMTAVRIRPAADDLPGAAAGGGEAAAAPDTDAQSRRIAEAYRRSVAENAELRTAATLGNRSRIMATAAVIGIFLFVGGWSWMATQLNVQDLDHVLGLDGGGANTRLQTMTVSAQPLTNAVNLTGTLEPGRVVNLVAPFAGQIKEMSFTYGERVEKGKVLLSLDTDDVEVQLRDAETALIQARQKLDEVRNWQTSSSVTSAQRSLEQAQMSLSQSQQNYQQTKALYEKGIVSQQELTSANSTFQNARVSVSGAKEALDAARKQGSKEALEVARLAFENAKFKYDSLKRKVSEAEVKAPVSGIVLRPVQGGRSGGAGGNEGSGMLAVGAPVTANQILLSVGDLQTLSISAQVSEYNIGAMKTGLKVDVTSDALPGTTLHGEVTSVSSQASSGSGSVPTFGTTITVTSMTDEARQRIRVGMSANLQVIIYRNPTALVVPVNAVLGGPGNARVLVVDGASASDPKPVDVKLGQRTASGIEITSGLKAGQVIVTNASRATVTAAN